MKGGGLWVFTWENAHQREFHAGVSYWFIIAFIRLQVFSSSHVRRDDVILVWLPCITHSSPGGGRFDTETKGRSSFTDTVCEISHQDEILLTARQPGWTRADMTVSGSIMWTNTEPREETGVNSPWYYVNIPWITTRYKYARCVDVFKCTSLEHRHIFGRCCLSLHSYSGLLRAKPETLGLQ